MMRMKLPMKPEEGGDAAAAADRSLVSGAGPSASGAGGPDEPPGPGVGAPQLDKETVFEWFGLHLNPARRIELMCGLLHMCQPLELRFLGSYLEDLARKDYHVLRDFEFRANSPSDLGVLADVVDPVVRSKLLVCLSLLGSDSRECAGILFRILSQVDPALFYKDYDYSLPPRGEPRHHPLRPPCRDGTGTGTRTRTGRAEQTCGFSASETAAGPLEQLALLFAMASLHPAFHFHQREMVRAQLDKIELAIEEEERRRGGVLLNTQELTGQKADYLPSPVLGLGECTAPHPPCQSRRSSRWAAQREAVHIEGIVLRSISGTRMDKEYNFEVKWSDSSSSSVTKTHLELENFLLKLPKDKCTESFEKGILRLLNQGGRTESREVEKNLRYYTQTHTDTSWLERCPSTDQHSYFRMRNLALITGEGSQNDLKDCVGCFHVIIYGLSMESRGDVLMSIRSTCKLKLIQLRFKLNQMEDVLFIGQQQALPCGYFL